MSAKKEDLCYIKGPDGKMYLDFEQPDYGLWGQKRLAYLKKNLPDEYMELLKAGDLNHHLNKVERRAVSMMDYIVEKYAKHDGVTEDLKKRDPLEWIGLMNNYRHEAAKVVEETLIR